MCHAVPGIQHDSCSSPARVPLRDSKANQVVSEHKDRERPCDTGQREKKTYRARIACTEVYIAGTLNVSKNI